MKIRPANETDAEGISRVLRELVAAGKRTRQSDLAFARDHYVEHPDRVQCFVAEDGDGGLLGFQSLKIIRKDNGYGTPVGWGSIGTHVSPRAARRGVGARLFAATQRAARQAGIPAIEAYIDAGNLEGQGYYKAMGFRTYRTVEGAVCKSYEIR